MSFFTATWPPKTPQQRAFHAAALKKDGIALCLVSGAFVVAAASATPIDSLPPTSASGVLLAGLAGILSTSALAVDLAWHPPPNVGDDVYNTLDCLGHAGFFTIQTLMLQSCYFLFSFYAMVAQDARVTSVVYGLSLWVGAQGIALTLLYYFLNWRDPVYQRDVVAENERRFPKFGAMMWWVHGPPLALSLLDLRFIKDKQLIATQGMHVSSLVVAALLYGAAFTSWMKALQLWLRPGTLVYPFVKMLDKPWRIIAFVLILWFFVSSIGLSLSFFLS